MYTTSLIMESFCLERLVFFPDLRQSGPREFIEAAARAGGADTPSEPHLILKSFCALHISFCLFIWIHLILLTTDCVDVVQISRS